jgi:heptosyltransferase I
MSAVGDAVHVLPVLTALKRAAPTRTSPGCCSPARPPSSAGTRAWTTSCCSTAPPGRAPTGRAPRPARARAVRRVAQPAGLLQGRLVSALAPARVKLGFDRARARDLNWLFTNARVPRIRCSTCRTSTSSSSPRWACRTSRCGGTWGPWPAERAWQRAFFAPLDRPAAAIVVATSKPEKDWPPERWAAVCDALWPTTACSPCSPAAARARAGRRGGHHARGPPQARQRVGQRPAQPRLHPRRLALVLSPDTGPLHMSVALGRPTVSLIAYSNPRRWGRTAASTTS